MTEVKILQVKQKTFDPSIGSSDDESPKDQATKPVKQQQKVPPSERVRKIKRSMTTLLTPPTPEKNSPVPPTKKVKQVPMPNLPTPPIEKEESNTVAKYLDDLIRTHTGMIESHNKFLDTMKTGLTLLGAGKDKGQWKEKLNWTEINKVLDAHK